MIYKTHFTFFMFFLCLLLTTPVLAQSTARERLEAKRIALKKEIAQINNLLENNQEKSRSLLVQVEDIERKISSTQQLIKVTNQQANLLTREINENLSKITKLRKDLEQLKADYAKMISKSYRSKSQKSRVMFLLSSESFLQAYKRLQYMKQYADYRHQQGEEIKAQTQELKKLNNELIEQRKAKESLLADNRKTQQKLKEDKRRQEILIAEVREKTGSFKAQLAERQKEISEIDAQIQKLIREAIAAENKKKGAKVSKNKFALTPEAKELAANFAANKGKLPWPVKSGVVTMKFGEHPSKTIHTVKIMNNGVRIETNNNEPVKAIFKGEVFKIQAIKGANKAVMIRHGDFISVYNNLNDIRVEVGEKISRGQMIGQVGKATATQRPTLNFYIFKNTTYLDPSLWIYKM
ncbi:murein hydrolase activator EnvC [Mesonia sp. HuA40]|uniref:murein hydrolase activator EnvC family protein n=1 Tax=Mesonia sp. HuA40 TaxID=2602761 RepID=UPI002107719B|nr:peptidoglycan DD-metalloendopeptidase family protein [Mesonia sp. HuA40]